MTSLLVTKTLFANKINTIAVFAVLEATIIFQKYCSTIQRAKYGTLGRFGLNRVGLAGVDCISGEKVKIFFTQQPILKARLFKPHAKRTVSALSLKLAAK